MTLIDNAIYVGGRRVATPRSLDEKRMAWAMGDIIHDRPALSRWHPDFKDEFARFVKE